MTGGTVRCAALYTTNSASLLLGGCCVCVFVVGSRIYISIQLSVEQRYCILFVETKKRDRDHIAHFRKFQYDNENHGTIQPHRGLCGMVSHFQISESHGLWFQGTCVCLLLLLLFDVVVSASVLFVDISHLTIWNVGYEK